MLRAGGLESGYCSDGTVAYRTRTARTLHRTRVRTPVGLPRLLLSFCRQLWGMYPRVQGSWLTGAYGRGKGSPRRPMEHSMAVLCGNLTATFGTGVVCALMRLAHFVLHEGKEFIMQITALLSLGTSLLCSLLCNLLYSIYSTPQSMWHDTQEE